VILREEAVINFRRPGPRGLALIGLVFVVLVVGYIALVGR
jgi:hypothetical protein